MKKILMVLSIILIIGFFAFGINYYKGEYSNFLNEGYVIDNSTNDRQYFSANTEYKLYKSSETVAFVNSNNQSKTIGTDTFIHYLDGSVSVLKKSAIVDLSNMEQKSFQYYTIYSGSVLTKSSNEYRISYLDKQLSFKEFLIKISSNKYMVVSPTLSINVGDETQNVKSGFIELTFDDGNIVKLQNQEINIQNVSSDIRIYLNDDTFINTANKKIYYKTTPKINLGEITINSDDNIEIIKDENNTVIDDGSSDTDKDNSNDNKDNNNGNNDGENSGGKKKVIHQGDFEEVASGLVDAAQMEIETIVEDNAAIKDAVFKITDFNVTANSMMCEVGVTDEEAVLTGTLYIKIIKASTNEVVYYEQDNSGSNTIQVEVMTLSPDTNYILIMNRDYIKNNITYNKDFIQKTFITSSLGISAQRDFVKTDELSIDIIKNVSSQVSKVEYSIHDNTANNDIDEGTIDFGSDFEVNLDFTNLKSNHEYTLVLHDFVYGNTIINSSESDYRYTSSTLKLKPTIGTTSFSADKKNDKFVVYLNNIKDVDAGIVSYKVDVYDASTNEYVTSKTSKTNTNIEFNLDGILLNRNTNYRVYTYLIFNDNEMEYQIPIGSELVNVTGVKGPIVSFAPGTITHEKIQGVFTIKDDNNTINTSEKIYVAYQNLSVGVEPIIVSYDVTMNDNIILIEFDENNLRSSDTYLFTIKAYIDYHDGTDGYTLTDIASFTINTKAPNPMGLYYMDNTSTARTHSFYVESRLINPEDGVDASYEASTMESIMFKLYSIDYDAALPCTWENKCKTERYYHKPKQGEEGVQYKSSLKEDYYDKLFYISEETLGLTVDQVTYGQYYLEVLGAYDYTDYKNDLPILLDEPILISANNAAGSVINKSVPVDIKPIFNEGLFEELKNKTQIGFEVTANLVSNVRVDRIIYKMYNEETKELVNTCEVVSDDGQVPSCTFNLSNSQNDNNRRGLSYYFQYQIFYLIGTEPKDESTPEDTYEVYVTKRQSPDFEIYQANRGNDDVTFKYTYKDIDNAVIDSKMFYYKNSDYSHTSEIEISKSVNEYMNLVIPFSGKGTIHAYVKTKLSDSDTNEAQLNLIDYYFSDIAPALGDGTKFKLTKGNNIVTLEITGLNDNDKKNLIGADVTFVNTNNVSKTFNNVTFTNLKHDFLFTDMKSLKSNDSDNLLDITANVKLYFDTGIYGVEAEPLDSGYALQLTNNSYKKYDDMFAFNKTLFNPLEKKLNIEALKDSSNKQNFTYNLDSGYISLGNDKVSLKVLNSFEPTCSTSCSFSFTEIMPTMEITSETAGVTTFNFAGSITGIEESKLDGFKIIVTYYECTDSTCDSYASNAMIKEITLDDFNAGIAKIDELDKDKYYSASYKWKYSGGGPNSFYFPTTNDSEYESKFHTTDDIGLKLPRFQYLGNYILNSREMVMSYVVGITDGYDGIDYVIRDAAGNIPMTISSETLSSLKSGISSNGRFVRRIDIFRTLLGETKYYIDIKPYYMRNGQRVDLKSITGALFTFKIQSPVITVSRVSDVTDNKSDIRVYLRDPYNAMAENRTFNVYVSTSGTTTLLGTGRSYNPVIFNDVECSGTSCNIIVKYSSDVKNDGYIEETSTRFDISISNNIYLGNASIGVTGDTTKIRINFTDSYKLRLVDKIAYTIYDESSNIVSSVDSYVPVWNPDDGENLVYTDLPENVVNGTYYIQMQLYSSDELVGNVSLDYIKG